MKYSRVPWALWAVLPVGGLAFHYGPGQRLFLDERAADLQRSADQLEREAMGQQGAAYAKHLEALQARRAALLDPAPEAESRAREATEAESRAFQKASAAWKRAAEAFGQIQEAATHASPETLQKIRWSRSRALVRAGDIWTGIAELESMIDEFERAGSAGSVLARATREELASAYYYAARLMRLSGDPAEEWLFESGKARQHFRYLAEQARAKGLGTEVAQNHERNVELVLDLEQSSLFEVQGKPLPKDSPLGRAGNRPGRGDGKRKRPPQQRDGRGAGGAEDVRTGW
ncbi:MAG TPA: hypothetical protein VGM03_10440 [Phycisphaerae bacterium]|jgi:hypothetical protein